MIDKADKLTLMENAAFRRFLFHMVETTGIFETTATTGDGLNLYREGRRSVTLGVLREMEEAQPARSATGLPILTSIQILREQVQSEPREKVLGRRNIYADLGGDDGE